MPNKIPLHAMRLLVLPALCFSMIGAAATHYEQRTSYHAPLAGSAPHVDGIVDDHLWQRAPWQAIDSLWLGPEYSAEDFAGRFKVVWTPERIFILVQIVDDVLIDQYRDPLSQYWDDDTLEIFVDEDYSGGEHRSNHNAFAYHFSLDNRAIDIGTDGKPRDYTHHVQSAWKQYADGIIWEVAIDIYSDDYVDGSNQNQPVTLVPGKVLGLMVAYCDNDGSKLRENFVGSEVVLSGPKDRGYIDAGLFGSLTLVE